jgi:hypothetical protein
LLAKLRELGKDSETPEEDAREQGWKRERNTTFGLGRLEMSVGCSGSQVRQLDIPV